MQDNSGAKQVNWIDTVEGNKLANDDSTNDLLHKENPEPIVYSQQLRRPLSKSIMKVQIDPFYAECFPPPQTEEAQSVPIQIEIQNELPII